MSKKKDKKRKAERKKQRLLAKVMESQHETDKDNIIPSDVAMVKDSFYDDPSYFISFAQYSERECEVDSIIEIKDRCSGKALKLLKVIGQHCDNPGVLNSLGFITKIVANDNEYQNIYNKLKRCGVDIKETVVWESIISGSGRLFFWVYNRKKVVYIIAIKRNHYKT